MKDGLLLDTHAWLWFGLGDAKRIKPAAVARIQRAREAGLLAVSVISVWEIGLLDLRRRITLGRPCEEWIAQALALPGLRLVGLDPSVALAANRLPWDCHGDPADRILIATARHLDIPLVTADASIQSYAAQGHLKVIKL